MGVRHGLVFLILSGCCCEWCGPQKKTYVSDVPATTQAAKALAKPPAVVVDVRRVEKNAGGGPACGHSAACVILLPLILIELAFPEKWDVVTITESGAETYSGTYTTGGDLIHGVKQLGDGTAKEVLALDLRALGQRVVVESARLDGDGGRTPVTLQSQHDFLADYKARLLNETYDDKRGALLREALQWLDVEAVPYVAERMKDPKEPDRSKAAVARALCEVRLGGTASPHERVLLDALGADLGPFTALAWISCSPDRAPLLGRVVAGACAEKDAMRLRELKDGAIERAGEDAALKAAVSTAARACADPERRALFLLELGEPVDLEGLTKLLQGAHYRDISGRIHPENPLHRAALFSAIGSGENTQKLLNHIEPTFAPLTGPELAELARAYVHERSFLDRTSVRADVLEAMAKVQAGSDSAAARAIISKARDAAKKDDQPVFEVALVVMGDASRVPMARKGASTTFKKGRSPVGADELVAYGLQLSGH